MITMMVPLVYVHPEYRLSLGTSGDENPVSPDGSYVYYAGRVTIAADRAATLEELWVNILITAGMAMPIASTITRSPLG